MSKILSNVLDKVSENNNEYRNELKNLNKLLDEKTTSLVGEIVTLSNYTVDFSNAVISAKERLVNPIVRIIESYAIKDLRNVETVNEQFVDKINDKIENSNISTNEEKNNFISNLNALLNDKYLEIVRIKRVGFTSIDGTNEEVENAILEFSNYLKESFDFSSDKLNELFTLYKSEIYDSIDNSFVLISSLYLNNFVNEVSIALSSSIDYEVLEKQDDGIEKNEFRPYIPEIPSIPEIDLEDKIEVPEIPQVEETPLIEEKIYSNEIINKEINLQENNLNGLQVDYNSMNNEISDSVPIVDISSVEPNEMSEKKDYEQTKKLYDVEEILKIAKSPIVTMPNENNNESNNYHSVDLIPKEEKDSFNSEFDEKEIVEEMIRRLTKRLELINERQNKYNEEKAKLEDDESFVNNLIESSNSKKEELDKFEKELDEKEMQIKEKHKELDKKINDVLPFANAIMKEEKKEA